jgi:tetratricopeptide (TPR) repeat protein
MKPLLHIAVLLAFLGPTTQKSVAQQADSLFAMANAAYSSSNYLQAIEMYQQILDQGHESAELYFNLGNAYYKENYLPKAILYYEKAKLLDPADDAISFNLQLANAYKVDQIESIPDVFVKKWIRTASMWMPASLWGYVSVALFALFAAFSITYLFSGRPGVKKTSFILGILVFLLSSFAFAFGHKRWRIQTRHDTAIIMAPSINIKSSPDDSGTDLFVLHEGTKVGIEDELGEWAEIRIADGNKGWIKKSELEVI